MTSASGPATPISYDGRIFRSAANSTGGDVGDDTTFHYHQLGDIVWATYSGGAVRFGTLVAKATPAGNLDMRYQHVSADGGFKTGRAESRPSVLPDGRLRVSETWEWTSGATGRGESVIEEVLQTPRSRRPL